MRRITLFIVIALICGFCAWRVLHRSKPASQNAAQPQLQPLLSSNVETASPVPTGPQPEANTNAFVRPDSIDEDHWNRLMLARQFALEQNQPVEFYARVVDQYEQPVEGAKLALRLSRTDEKMFETTNFFQRQMGDEVLNIRFELASDANGWIQVTGTNGSSLAVMGLTKEGYLSSYPDGFWGGVSYEPGGRRNPSGDILMTNAWNPQRGYIFHLWKKGDTERLVPIAVEVNLDAENQGQWVSNYFVRFIPGRVEWTNFNGADLIIQGIRRSSRSQDHPYEFTFTLTVPNGGILLSEDAYPYHAPETGYQQSWSFENKPESNPPDYPWTKTVYFKLRSGRIYGGVLVNFCSMAKFDFSFVGSLNPNGSPMLEPDPEKLITNSEEIRRIDETTRAK